ncbi:MAG: hypothetical protein CVU42_05030 [Chloroflexi bacterium HGW-Chloroflexi-4]|jgi:DNA-binding transcriptional LysR family regulator|nr:MAG: hypothetical protein CVU42_05030 [Chloroflexi bacterium HGW-Chloroflexi-4]
MDFKQVKYFLTIVDKGGFSGAAQDLFISQSSLSKSIISLEKELGVLLFDRSKRKVALTPAGSAYLSYAKNLQQIYQDLIFDLGDFKSVSTLKIATIPVIAQYGISNYISSFKAAHPEIPLSLDEHEASTILPRLDSHEHDLAFVRDNYLDKKQYDFLEIDQDKLLVVVSAKHQFAERTSITLSELKAENFIMFEKGTIHHEIVVDSCRNAGFEPSITYSSLRVESIVGLVASNSGISLMMEKVFNYSKHSDVVAIPLTENIESNIVLVWLKDKKTSKAAGAFIDFMKLNIL